MSHVGLIDFRALACCRATSLPVGKEVEDAAVDSLHPHFNTVQPEVIGLRIDEDFDADQHQKILNAIVVWNFVPERPHPLRGRPGRLLRRAPDQSP